MKTSELNGTALDWAVAKALGEYKPVAVPAYSTDWAQGGPLIEREGVGLAYDEEQWWARVEVFNGWWSGDTPLIAAMRCYVVSKLGDAVEIPDRLKQNA